MAIRRVHVLLALLGLALLAIPFRGQLRAWARGQRGGKTVAQRVTECGPRSRTRWTPYFTRAKVAYPPARVVLLGLKDEEALEVYAAAKGGPFRFIRRLPVLASSGDAGPKLREGDGQVPEGLYRIDYLNPNSQYHLSLLLDYPNDFDRRMAKRDQRTELGGEIAIHGAAVSAGCLAMGDEAAEDIFILAAETGASHVQIILTPTDFRTTKVQLHYPGLPDWTPTLYRDISAALQKLPVHRKK